MTTAFDFHNFNPSYSTQFETKEIYQCGADCQPIPFLGKQKIKKHIVNSRSEGEHSQQKALCNFYLVALLLFIL